MNESTQPHCGPHAANEGSVAPSLPSWGEARRLGSGAINGTRVCLRFPVLAAGALCFLLGCDSTPSPKAEPVATKPAEPAVPEEIQSAAQSLLGQETQVLLFGDLAKTGHQQFLAANVVPKTPTNNAPGTIVTRAVIAENHDGQWTEIFRCDEHLKNPKGFLGLTPLSPITGWRIQYEQDPEKGLQLYFTPLKGTGDIHVLPIGIRWNPEGKRYQSLDRAYEHFLNEAPTMGAAARSTLR